jgi:hypothetical protein
MAIDADGAPTAYHPTHGRGLDNLANAGHEGNWYGVVTDTCRRNGKPVVQGPNDPAPGFYVSPTALRDSHFERQDPRRYVDSTRIPYISLPGHHTNVLHAALGDLAMVVNGHNGRHSAAIFADVGPRAKIGEGSIALAKAWTQRQREAWWHWFSVDCLRCISAVRPSYSAPCIEH